MSRMVDVRKSYQNSAIQGATPIELVVLLYDAAIQDIRRALSAMKAGDAERRTGEIGHALLVLQQLQGTLDFERGGNAARQFEQFYNLLRAKLLEAQMRCSAGLLQEQVRYLTEVRDCWAQAKRMLQSPDVAVRPATTNAEGGRKSEWSA